MSGHDTVWASNAAAVEAFLKVTTQLNGVGTMDGGVRVIGLDYQGARAGLELAGVDVTPDLWADLQLVESGAVAGLAEARA